MAQELFARLPLMEPICTTASICIRRTSWGRRPLQNVQKYPQARGRQRSRTRCFSQALGPHTRDGHRSPTHLRGYHTLVSKPPRTTPFSLPRIVPPRRFEPPRRRRSSAESPQGEDIPLSASVPTTFPPPGPGVPRGRLQQYPGQHPHNPSPLSSGMAAEASALHQPAPEQSTVSRMGPVGSWGGRTEIARCAGNHHSLLQPLDNR